MVLFVQKFVIFQFLTFEGTNVRRCNVISHVLHKRLSRFGWQKAAFYLCSLLITHSHHPKTRQFWATFITELVHRPLSFYGIRSYGLPSLETTLKYSLVNSLMLTFNAIFENSNSKIVKPSGSGNCLTIPRTL